MCHVLYSNARGVVPIEAVFAAAVMMIVARVAVVSVGVVIFAGAAVIAAVAELVCCDHCQSHRCMQRIM